MSIVYWKRARTDPKFEKTAMLGSEPEPRKITSETLDLKPKPRGSKSKYPNSRVSGTKNHSEHGFWDLKPCYLGTWTLWETLNLNT